MKRSSSIARRGYSLIEVLIASAILMIGVSAATGMSVILTKQEEVNLQVSRGTARLETAARLFQMGLTPVQVVALLPADDGAGSLTFGTVSSVNVSGVGIMESVTCSLSIPIEGDGLFSGSTVDSRQHSVTLYRLPAIP